MRKFILNLFGLLLCLYASAQNPTQDAPPTERPQCTATTSSGDPCKRHAAPNIQTCRQHDPGRVIDNQCTATTKAGSRCKASAPQGKTQCRTHDANTPRCEHPTASGKPCKRTVKEPGTPCHQHRPQPTTPERQKTHST